MDCGPGPTAVGELDREAERAGVADRFSGAAMGGEVAVPGGEGVVEPVEHAAWVGAVGEVEVLGGAGAGDEAELHRDAALDEEQGLAGGIWAAVEHGGQHHEGDPALLTRPGRRWHAFGAFEPPLQHGDTVGRLAAARSSSVRSGSGDVLEARPPELSGGAGSGDGLVDEVSAEMAFDPVEELARRTVTNGMPLRWVMSTAGRGGGDGPRTRWGAWRRMRRGRAPVTWTLGRVDVAEVPQFVEGGVVGDHAQVRGATRWPPSSGSRPVWGTALSR